MTKSNSEYQHLADDLLKQFAQTQEDSLSAILTRENLETFQSHYAALGLGVFLP